VLASIRRTVEAARPPDPPPKTRPIGTLATAAQGGDLGVEGGPGRVRASTVEAESAPGAEPAVKQRGQLAGKEPKAFTAVHARQFVE
jgi:hypothetical protein